MPKKLQIPSQMPEIQPETLSQIHPARDWMPCHRAAHQVGAHLGDLGDALAEGRNDPRDDLRDRLYDLHDDGREIRNQGHQQLPHRPG